MQKDKIILKWDVIDYIPISDWSRIARRASQIAEHFSVEFNEEDTVVTLVNQSDRFRFYRAGDTYSVIFPQCEDTRLVMAAGLIVLQAALFNAITVKYPAFDEWMPFMKAYRRHFNEEHHIDMNDIDYFTAILPTTEEVFKDSTWTYPYQSKGRK